MANSGECMITYVPPEIMEVILKPCHPFDVGHLRATCRLMMASVSKYVAGLPTSAAMVKSRSRGRARNGEYHLGVKTARFGLVPLQVYCHGMDTETPQEYITLQRVGYYHNFSDRSTVLEFYSQLGDSRVRTIFLKVRVQLPSKDGQDMLILCRDFTFTVARRSCLWDGSSINQPDEALRPSMYTDYGVLISEYGRLAHANIDLRGTGLCVDDTFGVFGIHSEGLCDVTTNRQRVDMKGQGSGGSVRCGCGPLPVLRANNEAMGRGQAPLQLWYGEPPGGFVLKVAIAGSKEESELKPISQWMRNIYYFPPQLHLPIG